MPEETGETSWRQLTEAENERSRSAKIFFIQNGPQANSRPPSEPYEMIFVDRTSFDEL